MTVGGKPTRPAAIQGVYVLFDGETLAPAALLDGIGLTDLRTSAVSALAVRHLAAPGRAGSSCSAPARRRGRTCAALRAIAPIEHVAIVGPRPRPHRGARARARRASPPAADAVAEADVVCCCTTAREPLFDGDAVADEAVVVAIGSHEPEAARSTSGSPPARRSSSSRAPSALREAGDVIRRSTRARSREDELVTLAALVRGEARARPGRPRLFKSTGMAWEDLVLAAAVHARGLIRRTVRGVPVSVVFRCDVCGCPPGPRDAAPTACASCSTCATASTSTPSPAAG